MDTELPHILRKRVENGKAIGYKGSGNSNRENGSDGNPLLSKLSKSQPHATTYFLFMEI